MEYAKYNVLFMEFKSISGVPFNPLTIRGISNSANFLITLLSLTLSVNCERMEAAVEMR